MLALLFAVAEDLGSFAYGAIRSLFISDGYVDTQKALEAPKTHTALPVETETHAMRALSSVVRQEITTRAPLSPLLTGTATPVSRRDLAKDEGRPDGRSRLPSDLPFEASSRTLQKNTVMYTLSYATPLRSAAHTDASRDTILSILPYGSMVMVLDVSDGWAKVSSGPHTGWVSEADLAEKSADVYPSFMIGKENTAEDPNTIRVRAIINDEFGAGDLDLPLQAEEYVLYRLTKRGAKIEWPPVRPRTPGKWHEILKENQKVTLGVQPKAGALIEFMMESETDDDGVSGHIAYVEAVFPDDTIQISEANWPEHGIYNERVLTLEEWQALTPTFLVVA